MIEKLTKREIEVANLLAAGYTSREIARELYISVRTVESHRVNIYGKLQIKSRKELIEIQGQKMITKSRNNNGLIIIAALIILSIISVVIYQYIYNPIPSTPMPNSVVKAQAIANNGLVTHTITVLWNNQNIAPLHVQVNLTTTITLHNDAKLHCAKIYTSELTTVITPGQVLLPGAGEFFAKEFDFYNVEPGTCELYTKLWYEFDGWAWNYANGGDVITQAIGYAVDDNGNARPRDDDGFSFAKSINIPYVCYLPIIYK